MITLFFHRFRLFLVAVVAIVVFGVAGADELTPAIHAADIDTASCAVYLDGKPIGAPPPGSIEAALGISPSADVWKVGPSVGKYYDFRLAFKTPLPIGTIISDYTAGRDDDDQLPKQGDSVSYLKSDAPYPGDVTNESQWVTLEQGVLKTLPVGITTRALRFHSRPGEWGYAAGGDQISAQLPNTTVYIERYYSALSLGGEKSFLNRDNPTERVAPKNPEWWMGYWPDPQTVVALVLLPQKTPHGTVDTLKPTATLHPLIAASTDWREVGTSNKQVQTTLFKFETPISTKAVRFTAGNPMMNSFGTIIPLVNLGTTPDAPGSRVPPPPFKLTYNMPMNGISAVSIFDKTTNKLVRRLVAEVARTKGPVTESWDLRDDNGALVPAGNYTFTTVARPPFKLTYQMTPYNAGQPAWWAPAPSKGGGGWLGDHSPPLCATSIGDLEFFACPVQESGTGIAAVDHEGNKVWGEPYVTGFEIANRLASDDRYVYAINTQVIHRIDTKDDFKARDIFHFAYTRDLPGGRWSPTQGGLAARDGKIYVAFNGATVPWIQTGFLADDLDPDKSYPRVWLRRGNGTRAAKYDKIYRDDGYDELESFYSAFLVGVMPGNTRSVAEMSVPSSPMGYFGDAPKDGPFPNQLVAAFKEPVTVGSILLPDASTQVWLLKPNATLPTDDSTGPGADPEAQDQPPTAQGIDDDDWIMLPRTGKAGMAGIALAPPGGIKTQAIRFKAARLPFVQVMVRRFNDVAPDAAKVYAEGREGANGAWMLDRPATIPLNRFNPARMAYVWPTPVKLRGISFAHPNAGVMAVDEYIGPGDPKTAVGDDSQWKELGRISSEVYNGYYPQVASERNIDFGEEVTIKALRVCALSTPAAKTDEVGGPWDPSIPLLGSLVAYQSAGDDPSGLPPDLSNRITEFDAPVGDGDAAVSRQIPFKSPGALAFDKSGTLYAVQGSNIVTVPLDGGESKTIIGDGKLDKPSDMAFDADGMLYVSDVGPQVVKVFDPKTGELLRTIGKPGGNKLGPWDPNCIDNPTGVTIDSADKLWIVSNMFNPKRISRWDPKTGVHEASFFGPTQYGGGGTMDEGDHSVINYNGMKFKLDWTNMTWKMEALLERPGLSVAMGHPDRAVYYHGRRFLVGNGVGAWTPVPACICVERDDIAHPVVVFGNLGSWNEIGIHPDLLKAFGSLDRSKYAFVWMDKNGDGIPQASEVQVLETNMPDGISPGDDLAFNFDGGRLRPSGFDANGNPQYDLANIERLPLMTAESRSTTDGRTFVMSTQWDRLLAPDGKTVLWSYFDKYAVFAGFYTTGFGYDRPPGVLSAEQHVFGHMKGPGSEEYFVTSSDQGDWFCFTGDGFLVGCIFGGPKGYGLRRWTMPDWTPGKVDLSDVRLLQECYQGNVVRAEDGVVYAVAGKNYPGVVKVEGLEDLTRVHGEVSVTEDDIEKARAWSIRKAAVEMSHGDAKIAKIPYVSSPMPTDGDTDEWPDDLFFTIHEVFVPGLHESHWIHYGDGAMAFDSNNLYIAAKVLDSSPMRNAAEDLKTLFKTGDAIDVQLGLDPNADPARSGPVPGDVRILISRVKGQPIVMLYKYKVPGIAAEQRVHFTSPVGETWVDQIKQLTDAQVGFSHDGTNYEVTASIPWADLGVAAPKLGTHIKGDMGILQADQNGVQTVGRLYWSGKSQTVTADLPSEARLAPPLWGEFYFLEADDTMRFGPDTAGGADAPAGGGDLMTPDAP